MLNIGNQRDGQRKRDLGNRLCRRGRFKMNHEELAKKYFDEKYHCSQAVLAALVYVLGLTEEQALKLGGWFDCAAGGRTHIRIL